MENINDEFIEKYAKRLFDDFSSQALEDLAKALSDKKIISTSELYNSLRYKVLSAVSQSAASCGVSFKTYGRFVDMRHSTFRTPLPKKAIEEEIIPWVQRQGVSSFKYIPGYGPNGLKIPSEDKAIKRIAWGIGRGMLADSKHHGKRKRKAKQWYNKIMWKHLNEFTKNTQYEYTKFVQKNTISTINKLNNGN